MKKFQASLDSKSDETRNRIYRVALGLVRESGADSLTVRKIADGAGVSPALIIQYFGSKDKLLMKIFQSRNDQLFLDISAWYQALGTASLHQMLLEISAFILKRDLEFPSLTLQVMRYHLAWTKQEEGEFTQGLTRLFQAITMVFSKLTYDVSTEKAHLLCQVFLMIYAESSRIIIQREMTLEEGLDYLRPMLQLIEDGAKSERG